jgi:hypothetical protein
MPSKSHPGKIGLPIKNLPNSRVNLKFGKIRPVSRPKPTFEISGRWSTLVVLSNLRTSPHWSTSSTPGAAGARRCLRSAALPGQVTVYPDALTGTHPSPSSTRRHANGPAQRSSSSVIKRPSNPPQALVPSFKPRTTGRMLSSPDTHLAQPAASSPLSIRTSHNPPQALAKNFTNGCFEVGVSLPSPLPRRLLPVPHEPVRYRRVKEKSTMRQSPAADRLYQ